MMLIHYINNNNNLNIVNYYLISLFCSQINIIEYKLNLEQQLNSNTVGDVFIFKSLSCSPLLIVCVWLLWQAR